MQLLKRVALSVPQVKALYDDRERLRENLSRALEYQQRLLDGQQRLKEELASARSDAKRSLAHELLRQQDLFILGDIVIEAPSPPVSQTIRDALERDGYETVELYLVRRLVRRRDTVLDLGSGLGLTSIAAAKAAEGGRVVGYEADPNIAPLAKRNVLRNKVTVEIRDSAISSKAGRLTLNLAPDFLANSLFPIPGSKPISVESAALSHVLQEIRPNVITSDIEGVEKDIFADADLSSVDRVLVETHPQFIGSEGVDACVADLAAHGLRLVQSLCWGPVLVFDRNGQASQIPPFTL